MATGVPGVKRARRVPAVLTYEGKRPADAHLAAPLRAEYERLAAGAPEPVP